MIFTLCMSSDAAVGTMDNSSTYEYGSEEHMYDKYHVYEDYEYYNSVSLKLTPAVKVITPLGVLICLVGLVGNGLVLGLLGLSVKWGDFTVFIFHLSVADFLYLCCQIVSFMQIILDIFHSVSFDVRYMFMLTYMFYWVGLCLLTATSVARCLSVLRPIWCRLHAPRHMPAVVCTLVWVLSISVNIHYFLVCRVREFFNRRSCVVHMFLWLVFSGVLFSVTVMCILIVLFKVRCSTQLRPPLRFYITVVLTVLFVPFACPLGIYMYFYHCTSVLYFPELLLLLSCVNSSANPLVYYFVGRIGGRRRGENLREVFQKTLGDESGLRRGSSSGASTVRCEEGGGTSQAL